MRNLSIAVLGSCFTLFSLWSSAQGAQNKKVPINEPDLNKPKLFADLPDRLYFNPNNFSNLFQSHIGQSVNVPISSEFNFSGQVISKSDDPKSASVVIRSTNRIGARLIFTKVIDENNNIRYIGRIISLAHGDSYEIVLENNQYSFKKKGYYELIEE
jgi:hypothetical protein